MSRDTATREHTTNEEHGDVQRTNEHVRALYDAHLQTVYRRCDRVFAYLMGAQWLFAMLIAAVYSPYAWAGKIHTVHIHVYYAALLGAALSLPPILLAVFRPGAAITR